MRRSASLLLSVTPQLHYASANKSFRRRYLLRTIESPAPSEGWVQATPGTPGRAHQNHSSSISRNPLIATSVPSLNTILYLLANKGLPAPHHCVTLRVTTPRQALVGYRPEAA